MTKEELEKLDYKNNLDALLAAGDYLQKAANAFNEKDYATTACALREVFQNINPEYNFKGSLPYKTYKILIDFHCSLVSYVNAC